MPATLIDLANLQPTNHLDPQVTIFFRELTEQEIDDLEQEEGLGLPQVWETEAGLIISDGNHRTAIRASRGRTKVLVDYQGKVPEYLASEEIEILRRAKKMRVLGVYSPYDLLKT
ncbi:MAG: hypothetical protein ACTSWZ_07110 [Candidatus Heimdallarchaeaceae archaeon]